MAFATVIGKPPYTDGKILALLLMGCVVISFICFPRNFLRKARAQSSVGTEPNHENLVRCLKDAQRLGYSGLKRASDPGSPQRIS